MSASAERQDRARRQKIFMFHHLTETSLLVEIHAACTESRGSYGWLRIYRQLKDIGISVGNRRRGVAML